MLHILPGKEKLDEENEQLGNSFYKLKNVLFVALKSVIFWVKGNWPFIFQPPKKLFNDFKNRKLTKCIACPLSKINSLYWNDPWETIERIKWRTFGLLMMEFVFKFSIKLDCWNCQFSDTHQELEGYALHFWLSDMLWGFI